MYNLTYLNWGITRNSPGTAGSFLKAVDIHNDKKYYYKLSNFDLYSMQEIGHEAFNEVIASRVLDLLHINHVHYSLSPAKININDKECIAHVCYSPDFKKSGETSIGFGVYYEFQKKFNPNLHTPMDLIIQHNWQQQIFDMLIADFILLNRDRHENNWEIIRNENNQYYPAPLFDHNLSLILENNLNKIAAIDVLEDKPCQCFCGSFSTYSNLNLISKEYLQQWLTNNYFIKEEDYTYIFTNLELDPILINKTWEMLYLRSELLKEFILSR